MKKTTIIIALIMLSLSSYSQNGGQSSESSALKLEQVGKFVKVTNKQSGLVEVRTNQTENFWIFKDTLISGITGFFKAKPLTKVDKYIDMGWVELTVNLSLPVAFKIVEIKNNSINWEVGTEKNVKLYRVEGSDNSMDWNTISEVKADGKEKYSYSLVALISFIPFLFLFRNKKIIVAVSIALILFACTKQSIKPAKSYKYYRVVAVDNDFNLTYSNIIKS